MIGFGFAIIIITIAILAASFLLLAQEKYKTQFQSDLKQTKRSLSRVLSHPTRNDILYFAFYFFITLVLWFFYNRAMVIKREGIFTGASNNLGDLPFHLGVINSFVYGQNYPPEHLAYAGARFTYPFISDFIAATLVSTGAEIQNAMWIQNMFLTIALVGVLHYFTLKLTRDKLASVIAPVLLLFSGGLGWLNLFRYDLQSGQGIFSALWNLKHDYTIIPESTYRWGNSLTTLFITQRSILLGLPLSLIIFTIVWKVFEEGRGQDSGFRIQEEEETPKGKKKLKASKKMEENNEVETLTPDSRLLTPLLVAGVLTGLLPLIHAHTFAVVVCVVGFLALLRISDWKTWIWFFIPAFLLAAPQLFWVTRGASAEAKSFVEIMVGWDKGNENFVFFWLKNTGFFIPLLIAALLWRGKDYLVSRRLLLFYLPFIFLFVGPNVLKLAPWIWDNIKVLIYWFVGSIPLVAILLARLWRMEIWGRVAMVALLFCLTFAGALDVWRIASSQVEMQEYDKDGILFAEKIKQVTPPRSLILAAPTYNTTVFLTGRRLFLGYTGHVWSHGIDYRPREAEVKQIYSGNPYAMELLRKNKIDYVVVSPNESGTVSVNQEFFSNMKVEAEVGAYRLYKVEPK